MSGIHVPSPAEVAALPAADRAALAAAYLSGVEHNDRGFLPYDVFVAGAGKFVLSTVEVSPIRRNPSTGRAEILLLQRPDTDQWWANKWHIPGTAIRPGEEIVHDDDIDFDDPSFDPVASYRGPVTRHTQEELKGGVTLTSGPFLHDARLRRGVRGRENSVMLHAGVEVVDPDQPLPAGQFFDIEDVVAHPPVEGLVVGHRFGIARAAAAFVITHAE